jgi:hypothetical protein
VLDVIIPEIGPMRGCAQNSFHHRDVWDHSLLVLEKTEEILGDLFSHFGEASGPAAETLGEGRTALLKFAALLHDVAKPFVKGRDPSSGSITFDGHEREGALMIADIASRLRMPARSIRLLSSLVADHLKPLQFAAGDGRGSRQFAWFRSAGDNAVPSIILAMADVMSILGVAADPGYRERHLAWSRQAVIDYYGTIKARLEAPALVRGEDLVSLGMEPGPALGEVLARIRAAQDAGEIDSAGQALALAREMIRQPL